MHRKSLFSVSAIYHTRVALNNKKTDLSLETLSEINFELIKLVKCLILTKQIGNIIKMFGNLRFITFF